MRSSIPLLLFLSLVATTAGAQQPAEVVHGPLTLLDAIRLGRERGVVAAIARLTAQAGRARAGQRASELLPQISGGASWNRQTVNLDEFGIPIATGVTDPFEVFRLQLRASQTVFDAAAFSRLRAERDAAVASGEDARTAGELAGATAGVAYLRVLSARETVAARQADSTVAAELLGQARKLVESGVSPAIDATRSEVSFRLGSHPARSRPE